MFIKIINNQYLLHQLKILFILLISLQLNAQDIKGDSVVLQEAVKFLSDYVKINSETGNEEKAALFFADKCDTSGLHVKFFSNEQGSYNFIALFIL